MAVDPAGINAHYGREGLGDLILAGLRAAGKDPDRLAPADLAPVDQFHTGGLDATRELAARGGLRAGQRVLDVGGGLGGAARTLAAELGCRVTVLDLTEEYCLVGALLTARTGLQDRVTFLQGSALAMPFPAASFDAVWTQHSTMNIEAKDRLYAEIARVLRPGGRLVMHEILAGSLQPVRFPVPWAPDASISFLQPAGAVRALLQQAGFRAIAWDDTSGPALAWFQARLAARGTDETPLGVHLLLGPLFGPAFRNQVRNLAEGRIAVVQAVLERL